MQLNKIYKIDQSQPDMNAPRDRNGPIKSSQQVFDRTHVDDELSFDQGLTMATYSFLILAFLGVVYGSDVIELTDSNFGSRIKSMDLALVEFFAPW